MIWRAYQKVEKKYSAFHGTKDVALVKSREITDVVSC